MGPAEAKKIFAKYIVNECPRCQAAEGDMCEENAGVWIHMERFLLFSDYTACSFALDRGKYCIIDVRIPHSHTKES